MIQKAETASAAETAGCSLLILSLIYYIFNAVIAQWQSTYAAYVKTWIKNVVYPLKKPNIIELAIRDSRHRRRSTFDSSVYWDAVSSLWVLPWFTLFGAN